MGEAPPRECCRRRRSLMALLLLVPAACGPEASGNPTRAFGRLMRASSAADAGPVRYRGGAVLSAAEITIVFWGDAVPQVVREQTIELYRSITEVDAFDWIDEYDTPTQHISRPQLKGSVVIQPPDADTTLTDEELTAELGAQVRQGFLPLPGLDSYYAIYFPDGFRIGAGPFLDPSCKAWLAYHDAFSAGGAVGAYAVFPLCGQTAPTAVHELYEAVTDPRLDGWFDDQGSEIADLCQGDDTDVPLPDGGTLRVQHLWSNGAGACLGSPHEFEVKVVPRVLEASTTMTFHILAGEARVPSGPISWSISGLPSGVSASAPPDAGVTRNWTLTLTTSSTLQTFQMFVEATSSTWRARSEVDVYPPPRKAEPVKVTETASGCSQTEAPGGPLATILVALAALGVRWRRPSS